MAESKSAMCLKSLLIYRLLLVCGMCISVGISMAQDNIIRNGDFEDYTQLPTAESQIFRAQHWESVVYSCDYLNTTYNGWNVHNKRAKYGTGFAGFALYGDANGSCEAIGQNINDNRLKANTYYEVSCYVKMTSVGFFSNPCGGLEVYGFQSSPPLRDVSDFHVSEFPGAKLLWRSDTVKDVNWTRYQACFKPGDDIRYLVFTIQRNSHCRQYLYVDSIRVVESVENEKIDIGNDTIICHGDSLLLNAGPYRGKYKWQNQSEDSILWVSDPGKYRVEVAGRCRNRSGSIEVDVQDIPIFNLGADTSICIGDSIVLRAHYENADITWFDGDITTTNSVADSGVYWAKATINGCGYTDTIILKHIQKQELEIGEDTSICEGDTLLLVASIEGASYRWSNGSTDSATWVTEKGEHTVFASDLCYEYYDTITMDHVPVPEVDIGRDTIICKDSTLRLQAKLDEAEFTWNDGTEGAEYSVDIDGTYWVEAKTFCYKVFDSIEVSTEDCNCYLHIPNAFTPDLNQLNEEFKTVANCEFIYYDLKIFNRWGQLLFHSTDPDEGWAGAFKDMNCPQGTYVLLLTYHFPGKSEERIFDSFQLVK